MSVRPNTSAWYGCPRRYNLVFIAGAYCMSTGELMTSCSCNVCGSFLPHPVKHTAIVDGIVYVRVFSRYLWAESVGLSTADEVSRSRK